MSLARAGGRCAADRSTAKHRAESGVGVMRAGFRSWSIRLSRVLGLLLSGPATGAAAPDTPEQKAMKEEALKLTREARELKDKKKYDDAIRLAEKAAALREKASGPDSVDVVAGIKYLADIYLEKGDPARA